MNKVNIWLRNLGLKTKICPFLIHFMQPNASLIKKLIMQIYFLGKKLYPVGRAQLSSTSEVILTNINALFTILTRPCGSKQDFICRLQWTATKTIRPRVKAALTHIETRISWSSRGLLAKLPSMDEHLRCDLGISWKIGNIHIVSILSNCHCDVFFLYKMQ